MEKEAQEAMAAGEERTAEQARTVEEWDQGMRAMLRPTAEDVAKDIEIHRGSYPEIVAHRAPIVVMANTLGFLTFGLWRLGGSMLIGMALMKLGVFSARRSVRFYTILLVWGYGLGLPLAVWSAYDLYRHAFDPVYMLELGMSFNWVGAVGVALGHVAVVMLAIKLGWLSALVACLASTGRMALTNYLSHSLLLTPIFYGYGLGLFGQIDRFALMGIVLAVWILQLWWSPLWLRHFRFGPLEWSWRRLTYWKL
jgi:uncharacterized protein